MTEENGQATRETPRRIGVLGAGGQVGRCLVRLIDAAPDLKLCFALTRSDVDLTDSENLDEAIRVQLEQPAASGVEVVINAAAFTKVDACETEAEVAYQTNALAPAEWSRQLAERGVRLIHISTDYVFAGNGTRPYGEGDPTDPKTVYGASKRAGELAVLANDPEALVVRTSWVFGPGRNFVAAIIGQAIKRRKGEAEGPLTVVDDQHGAPTAAEDLSFALLAIARQTRDEWGGGLLHLRNRGETTWFGFAREILDQSGFEDIGIDPVPTSAFETPAPRPAFSVLDCSWAESKGIVMPTWDDALKRYLVSSDRPEVLADWESSIESTPFPNTSPREASR